MYEHEHAQTIKEHLHNLSRMVDAYHERGDTEALVDLREFLGRYVQFHLSQYPLPRDPRLYVAGEGGGSVEMPASGVRCPTCNKLTWADVEGRVRCPFCDRVYRLVTWLVLEAAPPTTVLITEQRYALDTFQQDAFVPPVGADGQLLRGPMHNLQVTNLPEEV